MARNQSEKTDTALPRPAAELLATRLNAVMPNWHEYLRGAKLLTLAMRVPDARWYTSGQPKIDLRDPVTVESMRILLRRAWPGCRLAVNEYEDGDMYLEVWSPATSGFVFRGDVDTHPVAYIKAIEAGVAYHRQHLRDQVPHGA